MTDKVLGPTGSPRRRRLLVVPILLVALVALLVVAGAQAVHDDNLFELDKNTTDNLSTSKLGELGTSATSSTLSLDVCETAAAPSTPFTILVEAERMTVTANNSGNWGGNCASKKTYTVERAAGGTTATAHAKGGVDGYVSLLVSAAKPGTDWNQVYASVTADNNDTGDDDKCLSLGLVECAFIADGIGPTTFTGGSSKDHLPVSGWNHTSGASPDKAEILNAYAAKGISGGNQILYFGMDRYAVDGSTDIGFWFFRNPVVANPDGTFTGNQALNDILILGTFTQGGAASNIRVFKWVGEGGNQSGTIEGPTGAFGDCVPGSTNDNGCATVNDTSVEVPWDYTFKGSAKSGWVPAGGGFEGGVDLTAIGLAGCFSSFLAETRSSPEITAILKDFALGSFEACGSSLTTTPASNAGTALTDSNSNSLPDVSIGTGSVLVKDSATLSVTGISTWSGTLDFYLCKLDSGLCDGTTNVGTKIGSTINVNQGTTQPILSAAATVTSAGRYCWRGVFTSSTTGVPNSSDSSATECFEVLPVQPTLSTKAIDSAGADLTAAVPFGQPIFDKATLSGTANKPGSPVINPTTAGGSAGGTITFKLYGPSATTTPTTTQCDTLATGFPAAGITRTVSGDGNYTTIGDGFTPQAPGYYFWKAEYSGDSPNTLSASHNATCADANERVQILQLNPSISTAQRFVPNDSATITVGSGGGDLAGSVVFKLYVDDATCANAAAYTSSSIDIATGTGTGLSRTVVSGNTTAYSASATFRWVVEYTSTNSAHTGVTSTCGKEISSITINNNAS